MPYYHLGGGTKKKSLLKDDFYTEKKIENKNIKL